MSAVTTHGRAIWGFAYPRRYEEAACPLSHSGPTDDWDAATGSYRRPGCTPGLVYVARSPGGLYKIGFTVRDIAQRLDELASLTPGIRCVMYAAVTCAAGCEAYLHSRFIQCHRGGEWFALPTDGLALLHGIRVFGGAPVQWETE